MLNIHLFVMFTGYDSCIELLLEHTPTPDPIGNLFSPLHCAVYVPV